MSEYDWKFEGDVKYRIVEVHIDTIRAGDTVLLSDGLLHTVCNKDLTYDSFMGVCLGKSDKEYFDNSAVSEIPLGPVDVDQLLTMLPSV